MKTYLIIGASSGIGLTLAQKLNSLGHKVIGTYNKTSPQDSDINFHKLNVLDEAADLSFIPEKLDGLAYCPGSINLKPFSRFRENDFTEDFKLQVIGFTRILHAAMASLKKSSSASVLTFSTVAVQTGFPFHAQVAASKGAIEGLTRALSAELAPSIRVNAIAPSITHTPLADKLLNSDKKIEANAERHPLKRIGKSEDIASAAAFLLTDESSWITGQILQVDGGISVIKN